MKLKDNFLTQVIDDTQVMVAAGDSDFNGIIRSNSTAAEIIDHLKEDTTRDEIIAKMCAKYEGADEQIASDVDMVIATLRRVGAIEE